MLDLNEIACEIVVKLLINMTLEFIQKLLM